MVIIKSDTLRGSHAPALTLSFDAPDHRRGQLEQLVHRLTNSPAQALASSRHATELTAICAEVDRLLAEAERTRQRYTSGASLLFEALPVVYGPRSESHAWRDGALMGAP